MPNKPLQNYIKQYDLNNDGTITDEEMKRATEILELELREEKAEAQKRMSFNFEHGNLYCFSFYTYRTRNKSFCSW